MNSLTSNRVMNPFLAMTYVAMVIILIAISIELLYQGFQFIETALRSSSRQAGQYFLQLAYRN